MGLTVEIKSEYHPPLALNSDNILETNSQKHLAVVLDNLLSFEDQLNMILNKINKNIGIFANFKISYQDLHWSLYEKRQLDFISITLTLYMTKLIKLLLLHYNAWLAITLWTNEKLYEELGLDSPQLCPWYRKLSCFHKNLQQWTSSLSLQTNPFKKLWLCY